MKTIVIYTSTTGFTKKYAEWIAAELDAELVELKKLRAGALSSYDVVIYGGSLHAVGIKGLAKFKPYLPALAGKKVIVFAVGATPDRKDVPEEVLAANFSPEERERIRFFYLRGGFDYAKLGLVDKLLMTLLKLKLKRKKADERSPDERGMLASYDKPVDFTRRAHIAELVACAKDEA
jgi:menaquinone-dependent protoporphyrinogen IX oxidase